MKPSHRYRLAKLEGSVPTFNPDALVSPEILRDLHTVYGTPGTEPDLRPVTEGEMRAAIQDALILVYGVSAGL